MGLHLIVAENLNNENIAYRIDKCISGKQYLHLCASTNIRDIRQQDERLRGVQLSYTNMSIDFNIATFANFNHYLNRMTFENEDCIRASDERYILSKIIDKCFVGSEKK